MSLTPTQESVKREIEYLFFQLKGPRFKEFLIQYSYPKHCWVLSQKQDLPVEAMIILDSELARRKVTLFDVSLALSNLRDAQEAYLEVLSGIY